ncbi:carboxymuconolactone decarboxylase family protein [Nesterenkonia pannonica]|uniref:carboxymuconolactone decarboxylase family protein n=1 Tax=Nesterenkonia pannonica TaxID=1548602 RepID=UPI002164EDDF|nr:carboxymuconolactone decarboxylase family protein [Nesterenkonia pannonica]
MSRVAVHTVESAPQSVQDQLKTLEQKFGKVLNIHGAMAASPVALQTYIAIQQAIEDYGTFDAQTQEAIALAVGTVDDCTYCQAAHTQGAKAAGLSEEQTVAIRRGDVDFDPKLAALLNAARQAAADKGTIDDDAWQAALDAGWTPRSSPNSPAT